MENTYVGKPNITNIVSIVILITMVQQNDTIFNHALTFCPFVVVGNMYVGKPNNAKGKHCHCHHNCPQQQYHFKSFTYLLVVVSFFFLI